MQMCHSVFGKGIKYRVKVEMTITRYSYSQIFSSDNEAVKNFVSMGKNLF